MQFPHFAESLNSARRRGDRARRLLVLSMAAVCTALVLAAGPALAAPDERTPVNINNADAATIAASIKGIGLKRAEQIVAYREQHGAFTDPYELTAIKGIGERVIQNNESLIRLRDF